MAVDLNRSSTNVQLPVEVSSEIWADTVNASAVMQLARQVTLPGAGKTIQTITGDATADWVDETAAKPVSRASLGKKSMSAYKLAVIEPFSDEFRRDLPGLYAELARRLPFALAKKFDETVFHGTAPGSNFDVLSGATSQGIAGKTYKGLVAADTAVTAAGGMITGWALAPQARQHLIGAVDGNGRPLFIDSPSASGRGLQLLGEPTVTTKAVYKSATNDVLGFAGDWSEAMYGVVSGVQVSVSNQATIQDGTTTVTDSGGTNTVEIPNYINLFQQNMFALRCEIEVGFITRDDDYFVKLTAATVS